DRTSASVTASPVSSSTYRTRALPRRRIPGCSSVTYLREGGVTGPPLPLRARTPVTEAPMSAGGSPRGLVDRRRTDRYGAAVLRFRVATFNIRNGLGCDGLDSWPF